MRIRFCLLCFLLVTLTSCELALATDQSTARRELIVTERILYRFTGGADGAHPQGGVIMDSAGSLYGITSGKGFGVRSRCKDCGTVFEVSARTLGETTLHGFSGGLDGARPESGLMIDGRGDLYGTTQFGGRYCTGAYISGCGTVFEIFAKRHIEIILHSFPASGGSAPDGGLITDSAGNLYGTTSTGSCPNGQYGCGTVFEIAAGTGNEIVLHTFSGGGDEDGFPKGHLVMDQSGNIYGTTWTRNLQSHISGVAYEIMAGTHESKILHMFEGGRDGDTPNGGLIIDKQGNLYGTTQSGGGFCDAGSSPGIDAQGCGTVFEINAGTRNETILYRFQGSTDGMQPRSGLVMDSSGNLYGTTAIGGINCRFGCGTVFEIAAATHEKEILYRFKGGRDGDFPLGDLAMDSAGKIYGTTFGGGANCQKGTELGPGCGTVFEIVRE